MNYECPRCGSTYINSPPSLIRAGIVRCLDCGFGFNPKINREKEPDACINISGLITIRRLFLERNGIDPGDKFELRIKGDDIYFIKSNVGFEVSVNKAGGFCFRRDALQINTLRLYLGGIKKGQSAFFKLINTKLNEFRMEEIRYETLSAKYGNARIRKGTIPYLSVLKNNSIGLSTEAVRVLGIESLSDYVSFFSEKGKVYISRADAKSDFAVRLNGSFIPSSARVLGANLMNKFLTELYNLSGPSKLKLVPVVKKGATRQIFELVNLDK
ncbi:hypothetical protein [Chitinophaga sp. MM2321]|uniref:hypothetical protein n=1 Tax=Chitinophaga sp. MM2321 TaxID=3137178 RepID=UPI0032D59442